MDEYGTSVVRPAPLSETDRLEMLAALDHSYRVTREKVDLSHCTIVDFGPHFNLEGELVHALAWHAWGGEPDPSKSHYCPVCGKEHNG
jgi:hypothetical protein